MEEYPNNYMSRQIINDELVLNVVMTFKDYNTKDKGVEACKSVRCECLLIDNTSMTEIQVIIVAFVRISY